MTSSRPLLIALLLSLAGCQSFFAERPPAKAATERLQGEVRQVEGQLQLQSCQGQRTLKLLSQDTGLQDDAQVLLTDDQDALFADLRGTLSQAEPDGTGQLTLTRIYRLQREGHGCGEENFKQMILRASGHEPGWMLTVTTRGDRRAHAWSASSPNTAFIHSSRPRPGVEVRGSCIRMLAPFASSTS